MLNPDANIIAYINVSNARNKDVRLFYTLQLVNIPQATLLMV